LTITGKSPGNKKSLKNSLLRARVGRPQWTLGRGRGRVRKL